MSHLSQHDLWGKGGHRVATLAPSPGDVFVLTTLFGRRVFVQPVTEYEQAVRRAQAFVRRLVHAGHVTVKVICLTLPEAQAMGYAPDDLFQDQTPEAEAEMRQLAVSASMDALRNSPDATVRLDAMKLLNDLGVLTT